MFKYFYEVHYTMFLIFNYRLVHIHAHLLNHLNIVLVIFHFNNIMVYVYGLNIYHIIKMLQYVDMMNDG